VGWYTALQVVRTTAGDGGRAVIGNHVLSVYASVGGGPGQCIHYQEAKDYSTTLSCAASPFIFRKLEGAHAV
jgi:hypothetical protein